MVMLDVLEKMKPEFEDRGFGQEALDHLFRLWETKLLNSGVLAPKLLADLSGRPMSTVRNQYYPDMPSFEYQYAQLQQKQAALLASQMQNLDEVNYDLNVPILLDAVAPLAPTEPIGPTISIETEPIQAIPAEPVILEPSKQTSTPTPKQPSKVVAPKITSNKKAKPKKQQPAAFSNSFGQFKNQWKDQRKDQPVTSTPTSLVPPSKDETGPEPVILQPLEIPM